MNDVKDYFSEQLKNTEPLTQETIDKLVSTECRGSKYQVGDISLFILVEYDKGFNEDGSRNLEINVEKILERQIEEVLTKDKYEFLQVSESGLPRFKYKGK